MNFSFDVKGLSVDRKRAPRSQFCLNFISFHECKCVKPQIVTDLSKLKVPEKKAHIRFGKFAYILPWKT